MARWMRRTTLVLGGVAAMVAIAALVVYVRSELILRERHALPPVKVVIPTDPASVAEGRRLATVRGCMDGCHGKNGEGAVFFEQAGVARLAAPNLTSAARRYSDEDLVRIIRDGLRPDGRSVLVMPSSIFAGLTEEDLGRIVAFLRSLRPIDGVEDGVSLGPIGRLALATGQFKTTAEFVATDRPPPPARSPTGERGRYLAHTICGECHNSDLSGSSNPDFTSPDLRVVAAYTRPDFVRLIRTGVATGGRELGLMRYRAQHNLYLLTDAEIDDLYEYLHGLGGST